jgi:murein DD-endopeptidase MepM/ murein hydrolase activator NlpD
MALLAPPPPIRTDTPEVTVVALARGTRFEVARSVKLRRTRVRVERGVVRVRWRRDARRFVKAFATQVVVATRRSPPTLDVFPFAPSPANRAPARRDRLPRSFRAGGCSTGCRPAVARRGWPIKPFFAPHPLRAGLNERRDSGFHVGIDIQARNRAPVYALTSGRAAVPQASGDDERVRVGRLEYWHLDRRVSTGDRVIAYRTVLGTIKRNFKHVHLSEIGPGGTYLDPLRPDGRVLAPYGDSERPVIGAPQRRRGRLVVEVFDPQSTNGFTTYRTPVLAPAALAWRVGGGPLRWILRGRWLQPGDIGGVYAPGARSPGFSCFRYRVVCIPTWRYLLSAAPPRRGARITVYAWDWAGNVTARDARAP